MTIKTAGVAVGTGNTVVYTCPANRTARVLSCMASNGSTTTARPLTLTWTDTDDGNTPYFLCSATPLDIQSGYGGVISGKLVLAAGDTIHALTDATGDVDILITVDEVSVDTSLLSVGKSYTVPGSGTLQEVYTCPVNSAARIIHCQIAIRHTAAVPIFLYRRQDSADTTGRRFCPGIPIVSRSVLLPFSGEVGLVAGGSIWWSAGGNARADITLGVNLVPD